MQVIVTVRCDVPLESVLNTTLFDMEKVSESEAWVRELRACADGKAKEFGVDSFVFEANRPFHPERLDKLLEDIRSRSKPVWNTVIRSKGHIWIATRPDQAGIWSHTGSQANLTGGMAFWDAVPRSKWPEDTGEIYELMKGWDPHYGDRSSELVMIGLKMDQETVKCALEAALVNPIGEVKKCCKEGACQRLEAEQASESSCERGKEQEKWDELEDPFPQWEDPPNLADDDDEHQHHHHGHRHDHGHSHKPSKR
jgi:hypothetical protein